MVHFARSDAGVSSPAGLRAEDDGGPDTPLRRPAALTNDLPDEIFGLVYRQMHALTCGRHRDLDDLVQAAAEEALRSLGRFERRSALSTWTYRICYHTLLRHHRSASRWLRRFTLTRDGHLPEGAAIGDDPDTSLDRAETILRLRRAVASLSPKRRAVVVMHDLEGLDVDEIAEIVDAKVATVRTRLRDGRKALAQLLKDDEYFGYFACVEGAKGAP
jgi:RNA polymerase sigma-70 factor, ECF subfamily